MAGPRSSLLGTAAWLLATRPELAATLRTEPDLIPVFVEEVLRLESPFRGHYRHVVADTTLGGVELPAGSHLYLLWGSANRDPAVFDRPGEILLERRRGHLAFGRGIHFCVGAAPARMEARAAIGMLLRRTRDSAPSTPRRAGRRAIWCAAFPVSISLWPDRRPIARPTPPRVSEFLWAEQ
ncbi:cytochrome P450 [Nocardia sp. NPDC050799]|uniref:cytochrome P450 n=1 Tax=Nocardia sp. NPDC050799 TaxID=3154842 RepID=UPI003400AA82